MAKVSPHDASLGSAVQTLSHHPWAKVLCMFILITMDLSGVVSESGVMHKSVHPMMTVLHLNHLLASLLHLHILPTGSDISVHATRETNALMFEETIAKQQMCPCLGNVAVYLDLKHALFCHGLRLPKSVRLTKGH